jgi:eukaryotic-like serine/threonine-protein kinase
MPAPSSPEIAPVQEGEILDGKYRVDRVLGVGGMGIVVAATHVALNQRVAIKFLLPAALANAQVIERFAREARAAVQIQSEHVARVIDVGTLPTGSPYMVMEFLEGSDLAAVLEKDGGMPIDRAIGYILQACEAIAEAHALGIVHRDLKPANLFLARRPGREAIVKVLDFGISKTKDAASSGLTQTSAVMGSPYYMAPEQMMSSKDVDARSDIWALGIILYELLTGSPPFAGESMAEVVFAVTQRDPAPIQSKRADVPAELGNVIASCLARDPTQRYPNVAKLAAALAPFGPPRSEISVERISRVLGASVPPAGAEPNRMRATASTWANSQSVVESRSKAPILAMAAAGAIVLLIGVGVSWRITRKPDPAVPAASSVASALAPSPPSKPRESAAAAATASDTLAPLPEAIGSPSAVPTSSGARVAPAAAASKTPPATPAAAPARARPSPPVAQPSPPPLAQPPAPQAPTSRGMNMGLKE